MSVVNLTEQLVSEHVYRGSETDYLWDQRRTGFGMRTFPPNLTHPTGKKKWVLDLRKLGAGIRCIADWPALPIEGAWLLAQRLYQARLLGEVGLPQVVGTGPDRTVQDLANRHLEWAAAHLKPKTLQSLRSLWRASILPLLGCRRLLSLTPEDVEAWHQGLVRSPVAANRAAETLAAAWKMAERWAWVPPASNPLRHLREYRFREQGRTRVLSEHERHRFLRALAQLEAVHPWQVALWRADYLTGARWRSELLPLRWSQVDLEARQLRLDDSKTGAKVIHLSAAAVELLAGLRRGTDPQRAERVFPTSVGTARRTWEQACRLAGLPRGCEDPKQNVRRHDLRRTLAQVLDDQGVEPTLIAAMLGNKSVSVVRSHYARPSEARLQALADQAATTLLAEPAPPMEVSNA
ncbi:MAG TPA: hypothetical protein DCQ64_11610 [Candidatus Rokubacteria bacterium]|nr:hypothetical protein [Candidatus Rokubacteria bacterium]